MAFSCLVFRLVCQPLCFPSAAGSLRRARVPLNAVSAIAPRRLVSHRKLDRSIAQLAELRSVLCEEPLVLSALLVEFSRVVGSQPKAIMDDVHVALASHMAP